MGDTPFALGYTGLGWDGMGRHGKLGGSQVAWALNVYPLDAIDRMMFPVAYDCSEYWSLNPLKVSFSAPAQEYVGSKVYSFLLYVNFFIDRPE
jgi:hypothetical protein